MTAKSGEGLATTAPPDMVSSPPREFSKGRDLETVAPVMARWLEQHIDDARSVAVSDVRHPIGAGFSNETILLDARWQSGAEARRQEFVLRIEPDERHRFFLWSNFRMQFDLLAELHAHQYVRVPEPYWFEEDPTLFGRPFFVMERMKGNVPVSVPVYNVSGWLVDGARPEDRRVVWETALDELCRIHQVPLPARLLVDRPDLGATGFDQEWEYWEQMYRWSRAGTAQPAMDALLEWLATNQPSERMEGLSWGDARMGNMMFGSDFRLVGVMDWEQASLSGPLFDLGWWLFFDEAHSTGLGVPRLDGLGTRRETIERWEQRLGVKATDLLWYEAVAGFKVSVLSMRSRVLATGTPPVMGEDQYFFKQIRTILEGDNR